jgi:hypothetical protein
MSQHLQSKGTLYSSSEHTVFHLNILGILPLQDSVLMLIIDDSPWMFECQYTYNVYDSFSHTTHSFANVYYLATSFDPIIGNCHVLLHDPLDDLHGRLKLLINIRKRVSYV